MSVSNILIVSEVERNKKSILRTTNKRRIKVNKFLACKSSFHESTIQVIPGNLQTYVCTNRSLLQCKTLPAHFGNNMMIYCLLNVI